MIDIGKIIIREARQQGTSIAKLAPQMNMTFQGLYRLLKRKDQKISHLLRFSQLLNHNFLQYYQPSLPKHLRREINESTNLKALQTLQTENKQLKQQLITLQRENNILNDFIQVLKTQNT